MAHFAKIVNNKVTQIIVAEKEYIDKLDGEWVQTSYNKNIRKNFASVGGVYDKSADAFYLSQPYTSWKLNTTSYEWEAPSSYPSDGKKYTWDESKTSWVEMK